MGFPPRAQGAGALPQAASVPAVERGRPPLPAPTPEVEQLTLATDGSAVTINDVYCAGWGLTVADPSRPRLLDFCGPVMLDPGSDFFGASALTNNTGELTGLLQAFQWLISYGCGRQCTLMYDSEYAYGMVTGAWQARSNYSLVISARDLFRRVSNYVSFIHIDSHTGNLLNERADTLALAGAYQCNQPVR